MYIGEIDLMNKENFDVIDPETKLYRNQDKTRKLLITTGAICLGLLAIFIYSLGLFDGELKIKPAVGAGVLLLLLGTLFIKSVFSLKDKSPRIILTTEYFTGKTAPLTKALGIGYWKDVRDIHLEKIGGDTVVVVCLANREIYRQRLSKMLLQIAEVEDQLYIMYSTSEIDLEPNELYTLFKHYWQGYRNTHIQDKDS